MFNRLFVWRAGPEQLWWGIVRSGAQNSSRCLERRAPPCAPGASSASPISNPAPAVAAPSSCRATRVRELRAILLFCWEYSAITFRWSLLMYINVFIKTGGWGFPSCPSSDNHYFHVSTKLFYLCYVIVVLHFRSHPSRYLLKAEFNKPRFSGCPKV